MSAIEKFSNRLKQVRGRISVKDLAAKSGVAATALYKAEGGDLPVSWKTVEKSYGELCLGPDHYLELLMLWALTQSGQEAGLYAASEAMTQVKEELARDFSKEESEILKDLRTLTIPERRRLAEFIRHYRQSPAAQRLVRAWMESLQEAPDEK